MDKVIEIEDMWKVYSLGSTDIDAVRGVSISISRGEFVALMGPSGSGKSSLMHLLGCLDTPTRGAYRLEGRVVSDLTPAERAQVRNERIGFVFQSFNLLPKRTALENVSLPLYYRRHWDPESSIAAKAMAVLTRVGLELRAAHRPAELSGGERQRVAIARALAADPAIILADEPTGNLDTATGKEIMGLLIGLNREGRTILIVTHSMDVAAHAGRVIHMVDGQITSDGNSRSGAQ